MLVLTSYYGEVRQHLQRENVTVIMLTCTVLSESARGGVWRWTWICACMQPIHVAAGLYVYARDGCDRENGICSRQSDLSADRLRRRNGGATSAAQLRGNPWHGVSY